jgi:hypothetical protein
LEALFTTNYTLFVAAYNFMSVAFAAKHGYIPYDITRSNYDDG